MNYKLLYAFLHYSIAAVWLVNGLFCKVLNEVPRHQEIVAQILGREHATLYTLLIGIAEIIMTIWIVSRFQSRLNAWVQIVIIVSMNTLEFFLTPDILLWGKLNIIFALLFVAMIYYTEFSLRQKTHCS